MKIEDFLMVISQLNPDVEIETGNATGYYSEKEAAETLDELNYYYGFEPEELAKDMKKVKRLIIRGDE